MKDNEELDNNGRIKVELTPSKKSVYIELDEESCKFLLEELTNLYTNKCKCIEYDADTGYDCGILTHNSLGFILWRRDS